MCIANLAFVSPWLVRRLLDRNSIIAANFNMAGNSAMPRASSSAATGSAGGQRKGSATGIHATAMSRR
jgi:hypothetical protein